LLLNDSRLYLDFTRFSTNILLLFWTPSSTLDYVETSCLLNLL
jgi:hypothetical protein